MALLNVLLKRQHCCSYSCLLICESHERFTCTAETNWKFKQLFINSTRFKANQERKKKKTKKLLSFFIFTCEIMCFRNSPCLCKVTPFLPNSHSCIPNSLGIPVYFQRHNTTHTSPSLCMFLHSPEELLKHCWTCNWMFAIFAKLAAHLSSELFKVNEVGKSA